MNYAVQWISDMYSNYHFSLIAMCVYCNSVLLMLLLFIVQVLANIYAGKLGSAITILSAFTERRGLRFKRTKNTASRSGSDDKVTDSLTSENADESDTVSSETAESSKGHESELDFLLYRDVVSSHKYLSSLYIIFKSLHQFEFLTNCYMKY